MSPVKPVPFPFTALMRIFLLFGIISYTRLGPVRVLVGEEKDREAERVKTCLDNH